jgi:hypothetical protein
VDVVQGDGGASVLSDGRCRPGKTSELRASRDGWHLTPLPLYRKLSGCSVSRVRVAVREGASCLLGIPRCLHIEDAGPSRR